MNDPRQAATAKIYVDVVIPMRNGAKTIQATLASVLAQTVQPRRIIVVDDGSSDDGVALISGHPLVDVVQTPPIGVSHARNVGIRVSRADYIAFLDCDDLWRADKLERQLEIVSQDSSIDVVTCGQLHVRMDGAVIPWTREAPRLSGNAFEELLSTCFMRGGWSSSILARRSVLCDCGGFDEQLQFGEDMDMYLRLARNCKFDYSAECLTHIRENPDSTMRNGLSPERYLEVALQNLSIAEKWIPGRRIREGIFAQCAWVILTKFARGPMRYDRLMAFRSELVERTPNLAAKIARSEAHFVLFLALFGALQFPRLVMAGLRYRARIASWGRGTGSRRAIAGRFHLRGGLGLHNPLGNVSDIRPQQTNAMRGAEYQNAQRHGWGEVLCAPQSGHGSERPYCREIAKHQNVTRQLDGQGAYRRRCVPDISSAGRTVKLE